MIRHLLIAVVMGWALAACGVGADEDLNELGLTDQALVQASSPDPVPPKVMPSGSLVNPTTPNGNIAMYTVASAPSSPGNPGDQNSSTPDPIPPKGAYVANGRPVPGDGPVTHFKQ
jgi:hypothetical protein